MLVLITRPEADAEPLARHLAERCIDSLIEPMLVIAAVVGAAVALDGVQALLVTSANGARALAGATRRRDIPLHAVGAASAACARELGFETVSVAAGDVEALAASVIAELDPAGGELVHVAGSDQAGDLAGALGASGFQVRREVLYEAHASEELSPSCTAALRDGTLDAALFFSPRTARTFVRLVRQAALATRCGRIDALCLSQAVADQAVALTWQGVRVAAEPTQESLLDLLNRGD